MEQINTLLKKYNNFKYDQIRSIQQPSDGSKIVTIALLDDDGEDTGSVTMKFKNINNSKLLVDSVLGFLDMSSGITLIKENNLYGFAVGSGTSMLNVHSSPLFIVASEIKIQEN